MTGSRARRSNAPSVPATASARILPKYGRQHHAEAGISGRREDIRREPAHQRQPRRGDAERAAPGMIDALVRKLREDLQHVSADETGQVGRKAGAIGLAAPEEKPAVGREPEIIDDEPAVGDRDIVADQGACPLGRQRLGRQDEVVDRHHARLDLPVEPGQIAIARQQEPVGEDAAAGGLDDDLAALRGIRTCARALEQPRALWRSPRGRCRARG